MPYSAPTPGQADGVEAQHLDKAHGLNQLRAAQGFDQLASQLLGRAGFFGQRGDRRGVVFVPEAHVCELRKGVVNCLPVVHASLSASSTRFLISLSISGYLSASQSL